MVNLIVAVDQKYGIGLNNELPWHIPEELKMFKKLTLHKTVIFGKNTMVNLPILPDRKIICITKESNIINTDNDITQISSLDEIDKDDENIFIAGGYKLYESSLETTNFIKTIYLSCINNTYECDTFFDRSLLKGFVIVNTDKHEDFTTYKLLRDTNNGEQQYLDMCENVLKTGEIRSGRNGTTLSTFSNTLKFDLTKGFPLLTTKKMFLRGIKEELLFFLKGETDSSLLTDKNVNIWKGNTSKEFLESQNLNYAEGVMGPMYGYNWRAFGSKYKVNKYGKPLKSEGGIDQLKYIVDLIQNDPHSRRIIMTDYNPICASEGVLFPCHSIVLQFYVSGEYLDMIAFSRSCDVFLGAPFNIASSSLMLSIIAKICNKTARHFTMNIGDTHIYEEHIEQVTKQINRLPFDSPSIDIIPNVTNVDDIETLTEDMFHLKNYLSHSSLKANMIA
jgi:dihydrofolate reductase/thymidylate synthase